MMRKTICRVVMHCQPHNPICKNRNVATRYDVLSRSLGILLRAHAVPLILFFVRFDSISESF
jgi:hypothetical protein